MFDVAFAQQFQDWLLCALRLLQQGLINESTLLCLGRQTSRAAHVGLIGKHNKKFSVLAIGSVVNLAARLCAYAADREILMNAEVAEAVTNRRPLRVLGNRPIKGYEEAMPVFGTTFDAPSKSKPMENGSGPDVWCKMHSATT